MCRHTFVFAIFLNICIITQTYKYAHAPIHIYTYTSTPILIQMTLMHVGFMKILQSDTMIL